MTLILNYINKTSNANSTVNGIDFAQATYLAGAATAIGVFAPVSLLGYAAAGTLGAAASWMARRIYASIDPDVPFFPTFFHSSVLLPQDLSKKCILEKIAQPSQHELVFFRFTRPDVAHRQIQQGRFNRDDLEFYQGCKTAPGQIEHKRMGKGVYAISPDRLDDLAGFGEDTIPRNNSALIKITLPAGSRVLDLTDPFVRQQLQEADIAEDDVAFIDPHVTIKFRENPGNKIFHIIKDLEQAKISPVAKADFEKLDPIRLQMMHSRMSALGQATIKPFLPAHFVPLQPTLLERLTYPLSVAHRTISRMVYSLEFRLRSLKTHLRTRHNLALLNPDKFLSNLTRDDFVPGQLSVVAADDLYNRGRRSIIKIKHEDDVNGLVDDPRFKTLVFSEEVLSANSAIRKQANLKKGDLFALIIPLPLKQKMPLMDWPIGQNPITSDMATVAFQKYFNTPYMDQNQTIRRFFGNRKDVVTRPNHSVLNGMREGFLSIDSALLIAKHAPNTEFGEWINGKIEQDPNFLKKIFFGGIFMRAARRGEDVESDGSALALRSAALIWNETRADFSGLFHDDPERASFARSFAYDHKNDQVATPKPNNPTMDENIKLALQEIGIGPETELSTEEKFYATLFDLGHYNDHRRMFSWDRTKAFATQDHFLKTAGRIENEELRKKIIATLWTRAGYYLRATGSGDSDLFTRIGSTSAWRELFGPIKNWGPRLWYRDIGNEQLFFKFSNHPDQALPVLARQQQSMTADLLPTIFSDDPTYLLQEP